MNADIYFYIAIAVIALLVVWRMVAGFRKGLVREILSLFALVVGCVSAYLILGAVGSYLNREIGQLVGIILMLLVIGVVYKLMNLLFASLKLVSRLPVVRTADRLLGALFGILEGFAIVWYIIYWLKNWGLSVLDAFTRV